MKKIIYFMLLTMCISACSSNKQEKQIGKKAENTIELINKLKEKEQISEDSFNDITNTIIEYDKKGFFRKYWFFLIFISYVIVTTSISYSEAKKNLERSKPLSKWKVYFVWLYSGLWGGHLFFLWNKHSRTISDVYRWTILFLVILIFTLNYTSIMYFYKTPQMFSFYSATWSWNMPNSYVLFYSYQILKIIFILNIIGGIVLIPYMTYIYNANYFRQHHENDNILNGKELGVDKFYKNMINDIKHLNKKIKKINKYLKEDYVIKDPDKDNSIAGGISRFFKNVVTGGNFSQLEKEKDRLRLLESCCRDLGIGIYNMKNNNSRLYDYLNIARTATYRNLYLSKELIGIIKTKISSKQQKLLVDKAIKIEDPINIKSKDLNVFSADFDSKSFFSSVSTDLKGTFGDIDKKINSGGAFSKNDAKLLALETGISVAVNGVIGVFELNSNTKKHRLEVQKQIQETTIYIRQAIPTIQEYEAILLRQSEILLALVKCNKAFVCVYEPLRQKVFGKANFWTYLTGIKKNIELFKTDKFRQDLQHLILVSSEYNKINKAKV